MGTQYLVPDRVWAYYTQHKTELAYSEKIIADNPEYGIEITMTSFGKGCCTIIVTADDTPIREEEVDSTDCRAVVTELYDEYLTPSAIDSLDTGANIEADELSDMHVREIELDEAIVAFVEAATDSFNPSLSAEAIRDLKEHFLEYLWEKHRISPYRPMYLEDENGVKFYDEFPYECMV